MAIQNITSEINHEGVNKYINSWATNATAYSAYQALASIVLVEEERHKPSCSLF